MRRERGEFSKGVVAAMKQRPAAPPPPPPPARRHTFATPPSAAAPPSRPRDAEAGRPLDDFSGLPPRLRERLERELARDESTMPPLRNFLIAVSVIATLGIVLILLQRFGAIDVPMLRGAAGTHATRSGAVEPTDGQMPSAAADPTTVLIDSLRREVENAKRPVPLRAVSNSDRSSTPPQTRSRVTSGSGETGSTDTPVPGGSESRAPATGTSSPTSAPAGSPSATAGSPVASAAHYGVGVASYLDEDRATRERDRIASETSLPAMVMPYQDAGTTMYRVVLGRWGSPGEAERSANTLMERGTINEARVVRLPRR